MCYFLFVYLFYEEDALLEKYVKKGGMGMTQKVLVQDADFIGKNKDHLKWMQYALKLAERSRDEGEVPVGAVIIKDEKLIAEGWNQPIDRNDATAHAEIMAIRAAGEVLNNYRLPDTTLYVTLEPCTMCVGAIIHARIANVIFGAPDPKTGAAGSVVDVFSADCHNHQVRVNGGVMMNDCGQILREFFRERRASKD